MSAIAFEAIILAGQFDDRLFPLTDSNCPKALLPVANVALLSYPLRIVQEAGARKVFVVTASQEAAQQIHKWVAAHAEYKNVEVLSVPKDSGTADVVRQIGVQHVSTDMFVVMAGDIVSDLSLRHVLCTHFVRSADITLLLHPRKTPASQETKPGKAPKNVQYMALDGARKRLLCYQSSPDTLRDVKVPYSAVLDAGSVTVTTSFVDCHIYIMSSTVLKLLQQHTMLSSISMDLLPAITAQQFTPQQPPSSSHNRAMSHDTSADLVSMHSMHSDNDAAPGPSDHQMHGSYRAAGANSHRRLQSRYYIGVEMLKAETYFIRAHTHTSYGDANKEVASPEVAWRLLPSLKPAADGKDAAIVHASVELGSKATVGPGCLIGERCVLGEKASVKRSVLGRNCRLGSNVKVINSVLMDDVTIQDGAHVQNSIVASKCTLKERVSLKDCQVGSNYVVAEGADLKGEQLANARPL